jgi:hypothetical protein
LQREIEEGDDIIEEESIKNPSDDCQRDPSRKGIEETHILKKTVDLNPFSIELIFPTEDDQLGT